jgi:hypothetical protein
MTRARDKANAVVSNFASTGIDDNADANAITIDSSEKVSIGDTSPLGNKVHIRTAGSATSVNGDAGLVLESDDNTRCDLQFMGPDGAFQSIYFGDVSDDNRGIIAYSHSSNNMRFTVDASERMRIDSSGRVGIGTSSPDHTLTVSALTSPVIEIEQTSGGPFKTNIVLNGNDTEFRGSSGNIEFYTGNNDGASSTERMRISASSTIFKAPDGGSRYLFGGTGNSDNAELSLYNSSDAQKVRIGAGVDSFFNGGNVTVGKTDTGSDVVGCTLRATGQASFTMDGNGPLVLNRKSSDGDILFFQKDNSTVGTIGTVGGILTIDGGSTNLAVGSDDTGLFFDKNQEIRPFNPSSGSTRDDAIDLGSSSGRFDDIFATNGTITTSDQNEKQDTASLTSAEITAAKAISKLFKTYKWKSKVAAKGDAARTHTGVIAQEVQTAMTDVGLDATKYAFWCSDTWWEHSVDVAAVEADEEAGIEAKDAYTRIDTYKTAQEAPEGATQRTRLGIRYPELLAFVGAATEQRLADIETRLTALEAAT